MFGVAFALIIEFTAVLTMFLALSAAPLERIRLEKILALIGVAAFLLLAALFGLVPRYPLEAPAPFGLLLTSALIVVAIGALEVWALVAFVTDWREADARERTLVVRSA
jgi:hypothetical protein